MRHAYGNANGDSHIHSDGDGHCDVYANSDGDSNGYGYGDCTAAAFTDATASTDTAGPSEHLLFREF